MTLIIIIFFIAIILAFGMLIVRDWKLRTKRIIIIDEQDKFTPNLSFRYFEKIFLFLTKHIIQWIVLSSVKVWFLIVAKTKVLFQNKLPKINKLFKKKEGIFDSRKISFIQRAVIESKIKIKKVKEKIQKEHEDKLESSTDVETNKEISEVDKIL
ncbi:MAG: hypothetical protein UR85_C0006G0011 [Candidatus Nomurabacteria bacterium GW2011_GWF2_35_66]|uniref:Uncharacterized protein n=1 Tax=Candidatus Nomurabacteria bacterium GW2011_GWE1_35_16 TaxID=1618761 RepID=A0A0G0BA74_9BACT|nr:MAG: hypothetical protein UR55_C0010G0009 [Candidatus Nomurabacteria bacterium GW2011_GWF1_34_20]KKP63140.1 MAG: hypothetical protein UR57_C0008G0011 [Candidatus Nomurabacteria bacterium GW2011_GWE2_34_25]KKP66333.1 MAG: hypothetical protein UR64_C0009G0036 [Candidatus Nomurabacteria bacterium GW2011_GWE1_35_16]KKP83226.1 MAG: hypothetical protein UR85_C0006G0011 [Candidatus Nomurabacteria bacterium GW2011_GWF2_35_66]HAE36323.1 hypothetical protein [Candidatus Nomurabacteria bacterium]